MRRKLLIAGAAVLAVAVLLSIGILIGRDLRPGQVPAPAATATDQEVEEGLPQPSTTSPLQPDFDDTTVGTSQSYNDEGSRLHFTVYRYRDLGLLGYQPARRSVAIEIKATVVATKEPVTLGWSPWSLTDDAGHSWEASYSEDERMADEPAYPDGKETPAGTSRRGWLSFTLPAKAKPTVIEYSPGYGQTLKWKIPQ
jgi:hypothetical protein